MDDVAAPVINLASGRMRILSFVIDMLFLSIPLRSVDFLFPDSLTLNPVATEFVWGVYMVLFMQSGWQATPGQKILRLRMISLVPGKPKITLTQATRRYFVCFAGTIISLIMAIALGHLQNELIQFSPLEPSSQVRTFAQVSDAIDNPNPEPAVNIRGDETLDPNGQARKQAAPPTDGRIHPEEWRPDWQNSIELLCILYSIIIACSVLAAPGRVAFHDWLCKTSVIRI